jgi:hypothetical protein
MKPIMLLLSASLAVAASGALAQGQGDACSSGYGSCMDRCSSRPKAVQESCAQMCEANTNHCYEGLYGHAQQEGQVSSDASGQASAPEPEARAAHDQAKPGEKPKRR